MPTLEKKTKQNHLAVVSAQLAAIPPLFLFLSFDTTGRSGNFPTNILSKRVVAPGARARGEKATAADSYNNSNGEGSYAKELGVYNNMFLPIIPIL